MPLSAPRLDDRKFQDLVDEAIQRIPHYCKEWTDHNVSDPGITLVELFAWMVDILLFRLNQVPDLHYVQMMEMMGITLSGPQPARTPVTFWLSAPQPGPVIIPAGTEVASTQTEAEPSILFTTDSDFCVQLPQLKSILGSTPAGTPGSGSLKTLSLANLQSGLEEMDAFSPEPKVGDALLFGFENDLSQHILAFEMDFNPAGGAGVIPELPPYTWEGFSGELNQEWHECTVDRDTTRGMNTAGVIQLHLPKLRKSTINNHDLFWLRVRIIEPRPVGAAGRRSRYTNSPRLRRVSAVSLGGTIPATNAQVVRGERIGQSDGSPGQRFSLQLTPLLHREPDEHLTVQVEGMPAQAWQEVPDFASTNATDRHYTLDDLSGELRFGPAIRQPDGTIKLYGAVPPVGARLVFNKYRSGGGIGGNVQIGILNTLKTAIPYLGKVCNLQAAWGGLDAETLEAAKMRLPAMLRSRQRAVTEEDFEFLACQALPASIGRVKCLQTRPGDSLRGSPGLVYILVIPRLPAPEGLLNPDLLQFKETDRVALAAALDEHRLLTTRLDIRAPTYNWVTVKVQVGTAPGTDQIAVEQAILGRLFHFLNPLSGGPDGTGWPFGRSLYPSDVYQCLQGIPGVLFIQGLSLYEAQPGGLALGKPVNSIGVLAHGVIASGQHTVEFVSRKEA